jgi:hypothetical protein
MSYRELAAAAAGLYVVSLSACDTSEKGVLENTAPFQIGTSLPTAGVK